jgi:actin, other eukaryote
MGYVVGDFNHAMREAQDSQACEKNYYLPDGSKILIGNERFRCAEILFNPKLAGHDVNGVH